MKKLRRFVLAIAHPLAHAIRWNLKYKVSARDAQDGVWIGFQCLGCEKITGIHVIGSTHAAHAPKPEQFS